MGPKTASPSMDSCAISWLVRVVGEAQEGTGKAPPPPLGPPLAGEVSEAESSESVGISGRAMLSPGV